LADRWCGWPTKLRVTPAQMVLLLLALPYAWLTRQAAGNGLLAHSATVANIAWLVAIGFRYSR
jgi:hypothetical protein